MTGGRENHGRFSLLRSSLTSSGIVSHAWGCYIAADFCLDPFFKNKRQFVNLNTMFTAAFGVKSWYSNIISVLKASQYVWDHASFWTLPLSDLFLTEWSSKTKMVFWFCWIKRRLLPSLNSGCLCPGCIDFSFYCGPVGENWIGNCRNNYFISGICTPPHPHCPILHSQEQAPNVMGERTVE